MEALVHVKNVKHIFWQSQGFLRGKKPFLALDDINFEIKAGETLGLVGESGCGKSTLARVITGLLTPTYGTVSIGQARGTESKNTTTTRKAKWHAEVQMVFQDPYSSLNPRMRVLTSICEPLRFILGIKSSRERERLGEEMLSRVGISPEHGRKYPHEFSGGQRQRIAIARALAVRPALAICDEPTSSLDASVQAQVLNLLCDMQEEFGLSYLFISHDLAVVRHMSDRIAVMRNGQIVELETTADIFSNPKHPYTRALLDSSVF